ncbi:hypothetical protein KBD34_05195 [Patescibacteria group bacterium]|nr:hypothetical protein [Patescibacteria group bacterium]
MNLKTIKSLAITSAVLVGVAGLGASSIQAASPTDTSTRPDRFSNLISLISQRFNLSQSDVQKVFDQQRTQMEAERETHHTEELTTRLAAAVKAGTITQAQSDLIKAKQTELKAFHESLKGKTKEECEAAMKAKMEELKTWAKANNIPEQFANFGPMGGQRGPGGPGMGRGGMNQGGPRGGMRGPRGAMTGTPTAQVQQ